MDINELKSQIMKNTLRHFYVFTGEEIGIINIYLTQISKTLKLPITRADSVLSIYGRCTARSLFNNSTGLYVIRNDMDFTKEEKAYATIEKDIKDNYIILMYEKIDSRLKFGKYFKDQTVKFEKLAPNVLKSYIKKVVPLSDKNAAELSNACNGSYDLSMLEADKVMQYANSYPDEFDDVGFDSYFEELLRAGVIYQPEESDVFKFVEAVMTHNVDEAFHLYKILYDSGVQSINMLGTLYNTVKTVLLIKCCEEQKGVCEITGLDNKQVYFNKKYVGYWSVNSLLRGMKLIAGVVNDIKVGLIDDSWSIPYVLVTFVSA